MPLPGAPLHLLTSECEAQTQLRTAPRFGCHVLEHRDVIAYLFVQQIADFAEQREFTALKRKMVVNRCVQQQVAICPGFIGSHPVLCGNMGSTQTVEPVAM